MTTDLLVLNDINSMEAIRALGRMVKAHLCSGAKRSSTGFLLLMMAVLVSSSLEGAVAVQEISVGPAYSGTIKANDKSVTWEGRRTTTTVDDPPDSQGNVIEHISTSDSALWRQTVFAALKPTDNTCVVTQAASAWYTQQIDIAGHGAGNSYTQGSNLTAIDDAGSAQANPWYDTKNFTLPTPSAHASEVDFDSDMAAYATPLPADLEAQKATLTPAVLNARQIQPGAGSNVHLFQARFVRCTVRHYYWYDNPNNPGFWRDRGPTGSQVPCDSWPYKPSGSPGWANGFDFDPDPTTPGDNSAISDGLMMGQGQLLVITIPGQRFQMHLDYPASDPAKILPTGKLTSEGKPIFALPEGNGIVRLWRYTYPYTTNRKKASVLANLTPPARGDFVPAGDYTESDAFFHQTGTPPDSRQVYFYIEGVKPGTATFKIHVKSFFTDNLGKEQVVETDDSETIEIQPPGDNNVPCGCGVEGQYEDSSSVIDNSILTYRHEADDFSLANGGSGCSSCGGSALGASGGTTRPKLNLHRLHRYDLQGWPSSFGPGVFLGYDVRLRYDPSGTWSLWDPARHQIITLGNYGTGKLLDGVQGAIRDVTFYDATGAVTAPAPSAARAVLTEFDGRTTEFELIPTPTTDLVAAKYGRPTRFADPRGQSVAIAYAYPAGSSDSDLGNDRTRLWKMTTITDAYGLQATCTYGASIGGYPTVASIAIAGGGTLTYDYRSSGLLPGLSAVHQLDGTTTTIDVAAAANTSEIDVTFDDPMAEGVHRQKIVTLSSPANAEPHPWKVHQVRKLNGEVTFRGLMTGDDDGHNVTLVQDGERIYRYVTSQGRPLHTDYLLPGTGTFDTAMATGTWETARSFALDGLNRVTGITDGLGQTLQGVVDSVTGYPTKVTYPDGTFEQFGYDAVGNRTSYIDRNGNETDTTYDAQRNRISETTAVGKPEQATRLWTYDAVTGALRSATDARGNTTTYTYNSKGLLLRVEEPADQVNGVRPATTFFYDALNRLQWSRDQVNREVDYFYDGCNRKVRTLYADSSDETVTYGTGVDAGRIVAQKDRNNHITTFGYDSVGRRILTRQVVTHADGTSENLDETVTYIPGSELVAARIARGVTTVYTYDQERRRLSQTVYATKTTSQTTTYAYDAAGRRTSESDPFSRRTFSVYDSSDRLIRTVRESVPGAIASGVDLKTLARDTTPNPLWVIEETGYDSAGRMTTRTDGRGIVTAMAYDGAGRLVSQTDAFGTTDEAKTQFSYDAAGNQISVQDPRGFISRRTYTGRNLVASVVEAAGQPEQATTLYSYTADRKQDTVTDANGNHTIFHYGTCCARLANTQDAADFLTQYGYDSVGNTTSVTDANNLVTSTTYDEANRPLTRKNGNGETTTYVYDDNLTDGVGLDALYASQISAFGFGHQNDTATYLAINLTLSVGANGSAVLVTDPLGNKTLTITDGLGRTLRTVDPLSHVTTIAYDATVSDGVHGTTPVTLVVTTVTDALSHSTATWTDGLGRVQVQVDALGNKVRTGYDADGNRLSTRDAVTVGQDCTYDNRNRQLTCTETAAGTPRVTSQVYDTMGNVLKKVDGTSNFDQMTYDGRNRKLTQIDRNLKTTSFAYDAVGNLLTITDAENGVTSYTYDKRNLLIKEVFPGATGGTRRYTYDAGRRLLTRTEQTTSGN